MWGEVGGDLEGGRDGVGRCDYVSMREIIAWPCVCVCCESVVKLWGWQNWRKYIFYFENSQGSPIIVVLPLRLPKSTHAAVRGVHVHEWEL